MREVACHTLKPCKVWRIGRTLAFSRVGIIEFPTITKVELLLALMILRMKHHPYWTLRTFLQTHIIDTFTLSTLSFNHKRSVHRTHCHIIGRNLLEAFKIERFYGFSPVDPVGCLQVIYFDVFRNIYREGLLGC
jgi:hypothetical protein